MLTEAVRREAGPSRRAVGSRARRRWVWVAVAVVLAAAGAVLAGAAGRGEPLARASGLALVGEFFAAAVRPELAPDFVRLTVRAAATTLGFAALGTALSLVLGVVGGVLASQTWWRAGGRHGELTRRGRRCWIGTRGALVVPRGIHEIVWGLFLLSVLGIEPVVAVLAIAIPFGAITAKVFSEIVDDVDRRPADALLAAGASRAAAFAYGVLPAAAGELTSYAFYRLDCAIRSATVLGLIGAGGLGFQLQLSFTALRYSEIWTLLYALIALSLVADAWGAAVRDRVAGRSARGGRDRFVVGSVAAAVAALPLAAWWVELDLAPLVDARSWGLAGDLLAASLPPTLGAGPAGPGGSGAGGVLGLVGLSVQTLAMSVLAIVLAFLGGLLLAGPAARPPATERARVRSAVAALVRLLLVVLRAIPPPLWALVALFVFVPGILPGAVALGVYTAGVLGRLMAETIENLDRRPSHALRSQGASPGQVFAYGVLPAAAPRFAGYGIYRWEVTIRETVIVGVVGAGGLGMLLQTQLALFDYGGALTTIGTLLLLTVLVDVTGAGLRRAVR
ncbi:ABC transporter permease subunit [Pseudonocardia sp.]|uniref:PhnE/PtxC family ABC transporter permease n=1 Tax=Pseudonocardia sp. TaxID=60912 RepID=UPI0026204F2E|nr:ABC transporter permease subunit [Pseudonocardia sp.]